MDNPFSVINIDGRGQCAVAARKIGKGEQILAERPVIKLSLPDRWLLKPSGRRAAELRILKQVETTSKSDQEAFWALHDCFATGETKSALGIWRTNAIATREGSNVSGIYSTGARFNHSCKPNVLCAWRESLGVEIFRAAREILLGEELCIQYCDPEFPRTKRQTKLKNSYNFVCCCEVCSLQGETLLASDKLRNEFRKLDMAISQMASQPREALSFVNRALEIIEQEFDGDPWLMKRACYDGFQMALYARNVKLARSMMSRACVAKLLAEGEPEDEEIKLWRSYADNPYLHPIAIEEGLSESQHAKRKRLCSSSSRKLHKVWRGVFKRNKTPRT